MSAIGDKNLNYTAEEIDNLLGEVENSDDKPTAGSDNLVKSGGVFDEFIKSGVFDLSAYNNGITYNNLSAALIAMNSLSTAYKKGGMSIKYIQSVPNSDNKYVQYRLAASIWSTDINNWMKTHIS